MSVKVLFKNNYSKNVKLLVVLLDDSLKLYGDILAIDKKNKGLVSRIIKNKSFSAKNKEKLSLIGLNIANIENIASIAPAAPKRCPVIDLVELTTKFLAESLNTVLIANVSAMSPAGVDVPWAFT